MAIVTEPIALDKSLNTTEASPRNLADVIAEGIGDLVSAISQIAPQTTYDELDKLNDVQITNVSNGQVLKWNGSKWVNANESGGSGGHTIEDSTGTALTQRTNLQFKDLSVTDDSINDATVVSASGKADKTDLTSISQTGSTATQTIPSGTYFYLNGSLVRAKTDIASGATFVSGTNYESGDNALNEISGVCEVWSNPNPTASFASRTVTFNSDKNISSIFISFDSGLVFDVNLNGTVTTQRFAIGVTEGKISRFDRTVSLSKSGTTYSVNISQCTRYKFNTYGSSASGETVNDSQIPQKIYACS